MGKPIVFLLYGNHHFRSVNENLITMLCTFVLRNQFHESFSFITLKSIQIASEFTSKILTSNVAVVLANYSINKIQCVYSCELGQR